MRTLSNTPGVVASLLACATLATSCQTYDFELVVPAAVSAPLIERTVTAHGDTPNLMLLVDTSGSMLDPMNPALASCRTSTGGLCQGEGCPASCPTRWSALQGAMGSFLSTHGTVARMGLVTYPSTQLILDVQCGGAETLTVDLPPEGATTDLQSHALKINAELQTIPNTVASGPTGGTPTGASLQFVGSLPQMQTSDHPDFVLLLTDGLPNCNAANANSGTSPACRCTVAGCSGVLERMGCLDHDGSVKAVRALRDKEIQTIVIGFGAETASGDGPTVLNAMAEAGGFARKCQTSADCGTSDTCDMGRGLCQRRYFQASNQDELAAALQQISQSIEDKPCLIELAPDDFPPSEDLAGVTVDGKSYRAGDDTWHLKPGVGVELVGALCERVENTSPAHPARVSVRAIIPH